MVSRVAALSRCFPGRRGCTGMQSRSIPLPRCPQAHPAQGQVAGWVPTAALLRGSCPPWGVCNLGYGFCQVLGGGGKPWVAMLGQAASDAMRYLENMSPPADAETTPKSGAIVSSSHGVFWVVMAPCPASSHCAVPCFAVGTSSRQFPVIRIHPSRNSQASSEGGGALRQAGEAVASQSLMLLEVLSILPQLRRGAGTSRAPTPPRCSWD